MVKILEELLEQAISCEMEWGKDDCVLFGVDVVRAITGEDRYGFIREKWKSKQQAWRHMLERGATSTMEAVVGYLKELGLQQIDPSQARLGDVGFAPNEEGVQVVVIKIDGGWLGRGQYGVSVVQQVTSAWSKPSS